MLDSTVSGTPRSKEEAFTLRGCGDAAAAGDYLRLYTIAPSSQSRTIYYSRESTEREDRQRERREGVPAVHLRLNEDFCLVYWKLGVCAFCSVTEEYLYIYIIRME